MRLLILHVDYFCCRVTGRGRSKLVEEFDDPKTEVREALVVLSAVEKGDETAPAVVAERATEEITRLAMDLKVKSIVLHPFAHLFGQLSSPQAAVKVLRMTEERLAKRGFSVIRTPFGWFNTLEIKAKGHPLSRVARIISVEKENSLFT